MSSALKPAEFVQTMINVGEAKTKTSTRDLILRGTMAGIILSLAVVVAITTIVQTGIGIVGALVFPVGFLYPKSDGLRSGHWCFWSRTSCQV